VAQLGAALAAGFRVRGARAKRIAAVVDLALTFATWQTLTTGGLSDGDAADAMAGAVVAAAN
jgi:hypothetical protein